MKILGAAILIALLPGAWASSSTTQELTALASRVDSIRIANNVPAAAFVVVSTEEMIFATALGVRDRVTQAPANIDTLFRIGSITKAFTSLALLMLQEQAKLSLNDRLRQHAPDAPLDNKWRDTDPVRISQLLEHTAGLLDLSRAEFDNNDPTPLTLKQGLFFSDKPRKTHWRPGMHSSYSSVGLGYAAYALEKVSKRRWEEFVTENIFGPLEMKTASMLLDPKTAAGLAVGYDTDGLSPIPYWHMTLRPFGAINVSAKEMSHFVRMLLGKGVFNGKRIISPASIRRMESPKTTLAARAGLSYGYGLGNYHFVHKGFRFHGHGGDGDGYLARYGYSRELNRGYFLVINAFNHRALQAIREQIEDVLIGGQKRPQPPAVASLEITDLEALTGTYQAITYRFPGMDPARLAEDRIKVVRSGDRLYTETANGYRLPLLPVSPTLFRRAQQPVATIAFITHNKDMYLQGDMGNYRRILSPR